MLGLDQNVTDRWVRRPQPGYSVLYLRHQTHQATVAKSCAPGPALRKVSPLGDPEKIARTHSVTLTARIIFSGLLPSRLGWDIVGSTAFKECWEYLRFY